MSYYQIKEIENGIFRLTSAEAVFIDLFVGTEKALLLDTGWGIGPLKQTIRNLTDKPLIIVNSHGHVDHVNGNNQFDEPIYIHPKDRQLRKKHSGLFMKLFVLMASKKMGILPENYLWKRYLRKGSNKYLPVREGDVFDLGRKTLEVVELPGHTSGSVGLLYKEGRMLYTSDAITKIVILNRKEAENLAVYTNSLKKALNLDISHFLQGHVEEKTQKSEIERYLKLAESADWEKAVPYKDISKPNAKENKKVRVMCVDNMTLADAKNPLFAGIVLTKETLGNDS